MARWPAALFAALPSWQAAQAGAFEHKPLTHRTAPHPLCCHGAVPLPTRCLAMRVPPAQVLAVAVDGNDKVIEMSSVSTQEEFTTQYL